MGNQLWQRRALFAVFGLLSAALVFTTLTASFSWINRPFPGFFVHENLTVGPYFLPGWSGGAAGVKSLDRVVAVEGRELQSRQDFYEIVKGRPAGAQFRYRIVRNGNAVEMPVSSMTFTFHDWFLSFGVYIVIGLAFLMIGVPLTISARHRRPLCRSVSWWWRFPVVSQHLRLHDYRRTAERGSCLRPDLHARRRNSPGPAFQRRQTIVAHPARGFAGKLRLRFAARRAHQRDLFWAFRALGSGVSNRLSLPWRRIFVFCNHLAGVAGDNVGLRALATSCMLVGAFRLRHTHS